MKTLGLTATALSVMALSAFGAFVQSRDQIRIARSSTVVPPCTQAVAEEFSNQTGAPAPIVESTGTGVGMQIFCSGVGEQTPDLTGASRTMTMSEFERCTQNGVTDITEALIGYDGLAIAVARSSEADWNLTLEQVYPALAAEVPQDGALVANPYSTWSEIDNSLSNVAITVLGPPPTSGTRDAVVELAIHAGCEENEAAMELSEVSGNEDWIDENCSRMRTDGPFTESGENDNLIVQRLNTDPDALGIFGCSFLYENTDTLVGVPLDGVEIELATIASGDYPLSRPLYFHANDAHRGVIPNLQEFGEEYMSDNALGDAGYLSARCLATVPEDERAELQARVTSGEGDFAAAE